MVVTFQGPFGLTREGFPGLAVFRRSATLLAMVELPRDRNHPLP